MGNLSFLFAKIGSTLLLPHLSTRRKTAPPGDSNPGVTSIRKPRNHAGFEVFLLLFSRVFPYVFPLEGNALLAALEGAFLRTDHMTRAIISRDVVGGTAHSHSRGKTILLEMQLLASTTIF